MRSYNTQGFCKIAFCSFRAKMATCAHLASPPNQSHAPKLKHPNPYNHQSKPKESADFENWESTFVRAFFFHSVAFQTSHRRTSALDSGNAKGRPQHIGYQARTGPRPEQGGELHCPVTGCGYAQKCALATKHVIF